MALGKILSKQSKTAEARAVYAKGSQATQGENPYIWQVDFCSFLNSSVHCYSNFVHCLSPTC